MLPGPDPADPNRILIRKIVQLREGSYAYEETTISKSSDKESSDPKVHTTLSKVGNGFDLQEHVTNEEAAFRLKFRPMPNVIGFSLYSRETKNGLRHVSIVENSLEKSSAYSWAEWWNDMKDRRDMSNYLKMRWRNTV